MKTVYVGEIDHPSETGKYYVDSIDTLTEQTKKLHVFSACFGTFKEANDYRNDLIASI